MTEPKHTAAGAGRLRLSCKAWNLASNDGIVGTSLLRAVKIDEKKREGENELERVADMKKKDGVEQERGQLTSRALLEIWRVAVGPVVA